MKAVKIRRSGQPPMNKAEMTTRIEEVDEAIMAQKKERILGNFPCGKLHRNSQGLHCRDAAPKVSQRAAAKVHHPPKFAYNMHP